MDKTHKELALEMLELTDTKRNIEKVIDLYVSTISEVMDPEEAEVVKEFSLSLLGWDSIKDNYSEIYANQFSESQLRDLIAFYSTPTGRALTSKVPEIAEACMEVSTSLVQTNEEKLKDLLKEKGLI